MSRTIESTVSLRDAREQIPALAEPGAAIAVSLAEAIGLVLAEPVVADVDQPPFDRAGRDGYAVRAAEAGAGDLLRVVAARRSPCDGDAGIEAGEAARVRAGDPLPPGADSVVPPAAVRPDPETGPVRVIELLRPARERQAIIPRGATLAAGATVAAAGTRVRPALVPVLAAQGCVHPLCHRRVGLSIVMVGDHWVRPDEAPTMNRERNAASSALVALTLGLGAMPHDFQAVAGPGIRPMLDRATNNPVVVILGGPSRHLDRALRDLGCEPTVARVAAEGLGRVRHGVIPDLDGRAAHHVFHLPADPIAASLGFLLLVRPTIARLQGEVAPPAAPMLPLADGATAPATGRRARVQPASIRVGADGRPSVVPLAVAAGDLAAWAASDGALVFPDRAGPWHPGDPVEFVPLVPGP